MTPTQWKQVDQLFHEALECPPERRADFLKQTCNGDQALFREVESLLSSHEQAGAFIETSPSDIAAQFLADEKHELPPGEKLGRYEIGAGNPVAERKSLVGRQIGPYQIVARIGAGGMGVVYKARDRRLERTVAVKVLPAALIDNRDRLKRFVREARAASALNHPNIITIYDIGNEGGIDFVVMEHVSGKTLDQLIPRKGMRLNEALKLAVQIADALAKAHSAGIIHRDLKPTNAMVTDDGRVKVLDFGLAKAIWGRESNPDLSQSSAMTGPETLAGQIVGTPSYMSPEQVRGKEVDNRTDIWAFGCLLYELLTGKRGFRG